MHAKDSIVPDFTIGVKNLYSVPLQCGQSSLQIYFIWIDSNVLKGLAMTLSM